MNSGWCGGIIFLHFFLKFSILNYQLSIIHYIITPPRLRRYPSYLKKGVVLGNIWAWVRKFRKTVHADIRRLKSQMGAENKSAWISEKKISVDLREKK
jgi:hypothetical protein